MEKIIAGPSSEGSISLEDAPGSTPIIRLLQLPKVVAIRHFVGVILCCRGVQLYERMNVE